MCGWILRDDENQCDIPHFTEWLLTTLRENVSFSAELGVDVGCWPEFVAFPAVYSERTPEYVYC